MIRDHNNRSNGYRQDEGYAEKINNSEQPLMNPLLGKHPNMESSAAESSLSMTLPVLEKKRSSVRNHENTRCGKDFDGDRSFRGENHFVHHPSDLSDPKHRINNYREWHHSREESHSGSNMLKKPPPSYDTPLPKGSNSSRHILASPSLETKRYQEANCDRLSFDKKPPPVTSSGPFLSKTKHQASPSQRFRARHSRSSVPQAIDVDLSFKTFSSFHYDENDTSQHHLPTPPPLSPISFSSSMLYKKSYYPSKESIEKQLSSLPPIESIVRKEPPSNNIGTTTTTRQTVIGVSKGVTATASEKATSTNIRRANTAQPTSEESSTAASQNRPQKPLRVNSQFPSQLQLQLQQQQKQQQKQQQQQQQRPSFRQKLPTMLTPRSIRMISRDTIPSPQPLPKGNGVTNGVATRIEASRQHKSAFPLDHNQEYDLRNVSLPTRNTETTTPEQLSPQPLPKGNGVTNGVATRIDARCQRPITFVPQLHNQEYDLRNVSLPTRNTETTTSEQPSISNPQEKPYPQDKSEKNVGDSGIGLDSMVTRQNVVEVEIYPGVSKVLRGAEETSLACERNFVVDCTCLVCAHQCSCIADAEFVICPSCMVVNPLHEGTIVSNYKSDGFLHKVKDRWGVGLGYIPETKTQR